MAEATAHASTNMCVNCGGAVFAHMVGRAVDHRKRWKKRERWIHSVEIEFLTHVRREGENTESADAFVLKL